MKAYAIIFNSSVSFLWYVQIFKILLQMMWITVHIASKLADVERRADIILLVTVSVPDVGICVTGLIV